MTHDPDSAARPPGNAREVFAVFLRLGLTSFGGPVAHLGYFRDELVARRNWLSDRAYGDIVALCQFMPGPASSQVGLAIGLSRAGYAGALAAWTGFTLPSALLMILFGYGLTALGGVGDAGWLDGLKIAAVAVVARAVWGMAETLCPDRARATLAAVAAAVVVFIPGVHGQLGAIALGGVAGLLWLAGEANSDADELAVPVSRRAGALALCVFVALLILLPLVASATGNAYLAIFDTFYRTGSLVFGGGHVVLPLLQGEVVTTGWVARDAFVAGYGAAQAVPGPLLTFAAYLGTVTSTPPGGLLVAPLSLVAIFLPSGFLVVGLLPFWRDVRRSERARAALAGINAAVVGLLAAALYDPVWVSGVNSPEDFALALFALVLLAVWKWPSWAVVLACAGGGALLAATS